MEARMNEYGVGSGTAIYIQNKLKHQMKHKLHDRCSNNQAEQMAIVKALQAIETIKNKQQLPKNNNNTHRQQDNTGPPQKQEKS